MYTLEIGRKAVAVIDADEEQARAVFDQEAFRNDLRQMTSDGEPLWDGVTPLNLRPASEEESETFDLMMEEDAEAFDEDETLDGEEEGLDVLFLVPIDDGEDDA